MTEDMTTCSHLAAVTTLPEPTTRACEDCLAIGDTWVHLRLCLTCGKVACCDSSKNKHASAHARESGHPVVRSIEPGERWLWCYEDLEAAEL